MDKYNAIEFINGDVLIYTGELDDEDFESDKKMSTCKKVFSLIDADKQQAEIDELKRVIAWANNSLFGSHGFFIGKDGEHHLDKAIEVIKGNSGEYYRKHNKQQAEIAKLVGDIDKWIALANKDTSDYECPLSRKRRESEALIAKHRG